MKSKLFIALCLGIAIAACKKDNSINSSTTPQSGASSHRSAQRVSADSTDTVSSFIPTDVANQMISSYLCSINAGQGASQNDTDIQSFSVNADSLREYLANPAITNVKLMFAHTMNWIKAGNSCQYAGYQSGALTIVIAAYDANGNYIYYNGEVLDHMAPCPYTCPIGAAGNNLLQ